MATLQQLVSTAMALARILGTLTDTSAPDGAGYSDALARNTFFNLAAAAYSTVPQQCVSRHFEQGKVRWRMARVGERK